MIPPELAAPSEVEAWVDEIGSDTLPEPAQRWIIDGTGSAEWAMRHVAAADAQIAALAAQAEEWRERIDAWLERESSRPQATRAFFVGHLERYALNLRAADPAAKTLSLPSGRVTTVGRVPRVIVTDEEAAVEWARTNAPDAITERIVTSIPLAELRRYVAVHQVISEAWVTNSCGCRLYLRDDEGLDLPEPGVEVECSECLTAATLGRIEPTASRLLARTPMGGWVPGVDVDQGGTTARVVAG
jgi:hypothetical protein